MNNVVDATKKKRKWARLAAVPVALVLMLAGCAPAGDGGDTGGDSGTPQQGGDLKVAFYKAPLTLDPIVGGDGTDHISLYPIFDRLINFTEDLKPSPGLATEWEYTDELTLVLTLREGVTFQDGTPLDAEAVKFNIDRARGDERSVVRADLRSIENVVATDPTTVTIELSQPDTSLPLIFADRSGMMVSPTALEADPEAFESKPVGAGAFSVVSYTQGDTLQLERYDEYWDAENTYVDSITINYLEGETANNALLSKQIDVALNVPWQTAATLRANPDLSVIGSPSLQQNGCYFNFQRAPFDQIKARQALAYALDKEAMVNAFTFGEEGSEPAEQIFPSTYWGFDETLEYPFERDLEKAAQLWAEAGGEGHVISVVSNADATASRVAEVFQEQVREAGIEMTVTPSASSVADFFTDKNYDMWCSGWSGRPDPSGTLASVLVPGGFYNNGGWEPEGLDSAAILAEANAAVEPEDRKAAFAPLVAAAQEEVAFLGFVYTPMVVGMQKNVHGYAPTLYGKPDITRFWIEQ